jgi:hypothetical protein
MEEKLQHITSLIRNIKSEKKQENITIVAVSKNVGINKIKEAYSLGIRNFGESRAQELVEKIKLIDYKDINWHFIGTLQKNKVKYVVPIAYLIHSVDSIELLEEINKQANKNNKIQNCLIEFKTSYEDSKAGIENFDELKTILNYAKELSNVKVIGLMTISPLTEDVDVIRQSFRKLYDIKAELNNLGYALTELSMGMSGDYGIAIEEGSTIVRIGTYIFGERDYTKSWRETLYE